MIIRWILRVEYFSKPRAILAKNKIHSILSWPVLSAKVSIGSKNFKEFHRKSRACRQRECAKNVFISQSVKFEALWGVIG